MQQREQRQLQRTGSVPTPNPYDARSPAPESATSPNATRPSRSRPQGTGTRSRAGCWTCRQRKVKCDEVHPVCGPCGRLKKSCDWEQRWRFEESTRSTIDKFANVNFSGNAVWDQSAQRATRSWSAQGTWAEPRRDSLPSFADLTNDEAREKKAEAHHPGTFNVIVSPDSFANLPEYADSESSRRASVRSRRESEVSRASRASEASHKVAANDPNTVFLTQFQDAAPTMASFLTGEPDPGGEDARPTIGEQLHMLDIASASADASISTMDPASFVLAPQDDEQLIHHYEQFIAHRILPSSPHMHQPGLLDPVVAEAERFAPLLHAMCAISLLVLANKGLARWEDALEREARGNMSLQYLIEDEDLNGDGLFFLHFVLLIYDVCSPTPTESNTWTSHLQQLKRIGTNRMRAGTHNVELDYQILSFALTLDIQAALCGHYSDSIAAAQAIDDFFPPNIQPMMPLTPASPFHQQELELLNSMVVFCREHQRLSANLTKLAAESRREYFELIRPILDTRRIGAFQGDVWVAWSRYYPPYLPRDNPRIGQTLSPRLRQLFENGYLFHCINVIYSSTCMFPGQLTTNPTHHSTVAVQCRHVLALAQSVLESGMWGRPPIVFSIFLAGVASPEAEIKVAAIRYMREFEGVAIGKNATKARQLLMTICEAQRQKVAAGGHADEVDWIAIARDAKLEVIDFGL